MLEPGAPCPNEKRTAGKRREAGGPKGNRMPGFFSLYPQLKSGHTGELE